MRYYTVSKRLADDIQEIALKCGYVSTIRVRKTKPCKLKNGRIIQGGTPIYEVIISGKQKVVEVDYTRNLRYARKRNIETRCYVGYAVYSGYVYCAEVPTHIIYVRRNGKPVWCGNSWVPRDWILKVLNRIRQFPHTTFFFLTKNPARYLEFLDVMPRNAILGATIETNRDEGYERISKAPKPSERIKAMIELTWPHKLIVIEPVLDFDLEEFVKALKDIGLREVYVGYDNYGNKLPEPPLEKTLQLVNALREFTIVHVKTLRPAWYERTRD